jgi:copper transport protein
MMGWLRLLLLMLGLCLAPLSGAWAHAALVASEPADGSSLDAGPPVLVLRFDEAVSLIDLRLAGPGGAVVLAGAPVVADGMVRAPLPQGLRHGTYLASFRIISADGHPVGGGIAFGIGTAPEPGAAMPGLAARDWALPAEMLRFTLYLGFVLGAGGALFRALVAEPPAGTRRWLGAAAWLGAAVALLGIGVQGGGMLGAASAAALLEGPTWAAAMGSTAFARGLAVALGLAVVGMSWRIGTRAGSWAGLLGAVAAAIGFGLSGHAAVGGMLPRALLVAHVLAAAYWLGAFLPLVALLRSLGGRAAGAVRRFAAIAMAAVALLLLSGVAQAASHLPSLAALLETPYGQLVLAKAAGAALLLALAAWNNRQLTPRIDGGGHGAAHLVRVIGAESVIAVAVLGVTAVLSMTPPRPAAQGHDHGHGHPMAAATPGVVVATEVGHLSVTLEAEPARAGRNRITLHAARPDGTPAAVPEVWLEFSQPQAGVAGIRRRMDADGPGRFVQQGPELALPGRWTIRAEILVNDFEQLSATITLPVSP